MVTASMRFSARALALPAEVRGTLAAGRLQSLDGPDQKRIDALWAKEAERRLREIEEGTVEPIDGELVMQRLRSRRESKRRGLEYDV